MKRASRRWAVVRRAALDRDGWRCRLCGKAGRLEVDHIQPLFKGGEMYALDNCQTLCRGCHIAKTVAERYGVPTPGATAWGALVMELR